MVYTDVIIKRITADEGKWLTNGETYSKEVFLGKNDTPSNWHEITEEEYTEIMEAQSSDNL